MSELAPEVNVFVDCPASTVDEVLQFLSEKSVEVGAADDAQAVLDAFKRREAEGTTGMMGGFAIPHAKSDAIKKACVIVLKLANGVEWQSMDNAPITCAISLLIPAAEKGTTHLEMLSKVAVLLMDEGFRTKLMACEDAAQISDTITDGLVSA